MTKILIVDDHPLIRSAVSAMLSNHGYHVVAETDSGIDAVQLAREHSIDLIILDLSLPGLDGLEVIKRIRLSGLQSRILVLTSQPALHYSKRCMSAGATGFITKTKGLSEVLQAVKVVMGGYTFFPDLSDSSVRTSDCGVSEKELIQLLSPRELEILIKLARGQRNIEIANNMTLSSKTISTYKSRLKEKLNMKSVVYLAEFAKRNNLI